MPCVLTQSAVCAPAHLAASSLDISNKNLHAAEMRSFAAFCTEKGPLKIRQLYMQGNPIEDEGLTCLVKQCFPQIPDLEFISLQSTHIGNAGTVTSAVLQHCHRSLRQWQADFLREPPMSHLQRDLPGACSW